MLKLDNNSQNNPSTLNFNQDPKPEPELPSYETLLELVQKLIVVNAEQSIKISSLEKEQEDDKETLNTSHKLVRLQRVKFSESKNILSAENKCLQMKNERLKKENERLKKNEIIFNRIVSKIEDEKEKELIVCTATQPGALPLLNKNMKEYADLRSQLAQSNSKLAGSTG